MKVWNQHNWGLVYRGSTWERSMKRLGATGRPSGRTQRWWRTSRRLDRKQQHRHELLAKQNDRDFMNGTGAWADV